MEIWYKVLQKVFSNTDLFEKLIYYFCASLSVGRTNQDILSDSCSNIKYFILNCIRDGSCYLILDQCFLCICLYLTFMNIQ